MHTQTMCTVIGRCVDAGRRPVTGARVCFLWLKTTETNSYETFDEIFCCESDDTGRFELAFAPGEDLAGVPILSLAIACTRKGFAEGLVLVRPLEERAFDAGDVVLTRGAILSGAVKDASGAPEPDVTVELWHHELDDFIADAPFVLTGAAGTFRLEDAPSGNLMLTAKGAHGRESRTLELDARPGEHVDGIDLVLPLFEDEQAITGVVTGRDGAPAADACVRVSRVLRNGARRQWCDTDNRGRFRVEVALGEIVTLRAEGDGFTSSSAILHDVPGGTHGIAFSLHASPSIRLRVRDGRGRPVEVFGWRLYDVEAGDERRMNVVDPAMHPGGETTLATSLDPFELRVEADGCETAKLGPLRSAEVGDTIDVHLARMPPVLGIVLHRGRPVPAAEVTLREVVPASRRLTDAGFDLRWRFCSDVPETTTDASGGFRLLPPKSGLFVVRIDAEGLPATWSAELDVARDGEDVAVTIEVPEAGSIEGVIRLRDGSPAAGRWVLASCGDGGMRARESGADGSYVLPRLAPGDWQVRAYPTWADVHQSVEEGIFPPFSEIPPIAWDCRVVAGETARHDFEVEPTSDLEVRLGPPFDSEAWKAALRLACPWEARQHPSTHPMKQTAGTWYAQLSCPGDADVQLTSEIGRAWHHWYFRVTLVGGHNSAHLQFPTGTLEGRVDVPDPKSAFVELIHQQEEVYACVRVRPTADGRFTIPLAPAGECTLKVEAAVARPERTVVVPAGGKVDVGEL